MSFGEFMLSTGFIQKTIKVDLYVRVNHSYLQQDRHQKDLEDSREHHTTTEGEPLPGAAGWPHQSCWLAP
jgi:hypothetical protein